MADHGDNYVRQTGEGGEEIGALGPACGHHCGVITVGGNDKHIGHCPCKECHAGSVGYPVAVKIGNTGRVPRVT